MVSITLKGAVEDYLAVNALINTVDQRTEPRSGQRDETQYLSV